MEVKQKLAAEPAIEGIPSQSRIAPFNTPTQRETLTTPRASQCYAAREFSAEM